MSQETQARINISNYYILFSTTAQLSKVALEEIQYAYKILKDKSKIIIIYDVAQGKNMKGTDGCTELYYNRKTQTPESFIANVMRRIQNQHAALTRVAKQNDEALAGLILAGLGLLLLGALTTSKK
ncbi:MAG: hypothetical protein JSS82_16615 [Bacteroidetes bacterium]|nr:hypothetical protein [Bacteroidota bacterium]